MSKNTIQEQFDQYVMLLEEIHALGHEIDAAIEEVEINELMLKRKRYKQKMRRVVKNLVDSLSEMGTKYPIHNYLANQTTYIFALDNKLMLEYH
ncbi:MAG: hypothetical protein EOO86_02825 [Pedobacter sp.]|nr:MAG: hypothetical protein EOO86_02825 [Pedobacter sp.]